MTTRRKRRNHEEVQRARAAGLLRSLRPFDEWLQDAPRSEADVAAYWRMAQELKGIANGTVSVTSVPSAEHHREQGPVVSDSRDETPPVDAVTADSRDRLITPDTLWFTDHRRGFRATRRGEQAIEAFREADKLDALPRQIDGDDVAYTREAEKFRAYGQALLAPSERVSVAHGEAIAYDAIATPDRFDAGGIIDTLEKSPTSVAIGASGKRSEALERVGILEPALDTADSAQASNAIEKMLCHQMAAAHFTALRLLERSTNEKLPTIEVARLTNAAARMMDVYQNACLVLQKLKAKGRQHVVVQYQQVNVGDGGQAVVAGRVAARAQRGRRKTPR